MDNRTRDRLLDAFFKAAGGATANPIGDVLDIGSTNGPDSTGGEMAPNSNGSLTAGIGDLYGSSAVSAGANVYSPAPISSSGTGAGSAVAGFASDIFESGFGVAGLAKGLIGLFSGGASAPPPLERYELPASISFSSAETGGALYGGDYDATGAPRPIPAGASSAGGSGSPAAPQVTVNVQAMDAQSFLDHSSAIADAVRGAMLNMSSINDVVNDLT